MRPYALLAGVLAVVSLSACASTSREAPAPPAQPKAQPPAQPQAEPQTEESPESMLAEPIRWRRSVAVGSTNAGRLVRGVQLPSEGEHFFTWDPIRNVVPNRPWRRYGTDRLVRMLLRVLREYHAANPGAPRVAVSDLSRPQGGNFGPQYGVPGHASHQNGLDVDVYYPRLDELERGPANVSQVDRELSQDLVDRFVRAGAQFVFVGLRVDLRGPGRIVQAIPYHDNHMHVRIR